MKYYLVQFLLLFCLASCSNVSIGDKMFVRKIDYDYSFSKMKDSSLNQFKNKFGTDFVYKELDSNKKRLYVSHITFKNRDIFFYKPPLYFEFKNDIMIEFGVIKPGFSSLIFKRFENGQKFVKKEKVFQTTKSK
jgi:ABC-type microcin C transport system permease subunit YejE